MIGPHVIRHRLVNALPVIVLSINLSSAIKMPENPVLHFSFRMYVTIDVPIVIRFRWT